MINKQRYIEEYLSKVKDIHPKLEHVFNLETIENYERSTGKAVGIIPNLPFNTIIMPLVKPRGASDDKAFVYPHLTYPDGKGGAAALITITVVQGETSETYYLFEKNQRFTAHNDFFLEIPRGFKDYSDNTLVDCICREVYEETGLKVRANQATHLGSMMVDTGLSDNKVELYHLSLVSDSIDDVKLKTNDTTEAIVGFQLYSEEEVYELLLQNKIIDSFSQIAIFRHMLLGFDKAIKSI